LIEASGEQLLRGTAAGFLVALIAFAACGGEIANDLTSDVHVDRGILVPDAGAKPPPRETDVDENPPDAGQRPSVCSPQAIPQFAPQWHPPTPFHQGRCLSTQIKTLVDCNFDPNVNDPNCKALRLYPANQDCQACLATPVSASLYGPLVTDGDYANLNIAGCIANVEGNASATSCGAKFDIANQCSASACRGCSDKNLKALDACMSKAAEGLCANYAAAADCADALLDANGPAAACMPGNSWLESAAILGTLFCGK
jgi:hypothetical protein